MPVRIGHLLFDQADYDADGDVLYLHVGAPSASEGEETPEGHVLHYRPGTPEVVGLTLLGPRSLIDRDGGVTVTVPRAVEVSADDLAPVLRPA